MASNSSSAFSFPPNSEPLILSFFELMITSPFWVSVFRLLLTSSSTLTSLAPVLSASASLLTSKCVSGLEYEYKAVNLLKGEQFRPEFKKLNPFGFVPVLVDGDVVVADSFAIIMYLEEKYPDKPLLPQDPKLKAINLQAASVVGSGIQPLQNLSLLKLIEEKLNAAEKDAWVHYHIGKGFAALDELLKSYAGKYATGDEFYMSRYPFLSRLNDAYNELP